MQNEEKKYPEPGVIAVIVNKNNELLFLRSKKWLNKFIFPGGHIEINEKLSDAVKRKAKEEAGINVIVVDQLAFCEGILPKELKERKHYIALGFLCKYDGEINEIRVNQAIGNEYVWLKVEKALELDLPEITKSVLNKFVEYQNAQHTLDSWKRCQADFENYKKDQAKGREEFAKFAKMDMILQILPVLDNFEISLEHVPEEKKENKWVEGITHIKRQIEDVLKNNNVEEIVVKIGDGFDPEIHEAVAGKGEKVKKVLQKGYRLNGRIVRAARAEVG